MLLVRQPTKQILRDVIDGVLAGRYSREEVSTWYKAVSNQSGYTPLTVEDGYWYLESLSALDIPMLMGEGGFFIRDRDLLEYEADLEGHPAGEVFEGIRRLRVHQLKPFPVFKPLLMFDQPDYTALDRIGLTAVRGIFDPHLDLVEHIHLEFDEQLYLIVRQYDDQARTLMVLGTNRDPAIMRAMFSRLGIA